ncbi:TetR family transcriptional regulator [Pseudonocardia sp. GCM10023141]|uniref:TetR family transcriptional regulator n=1 Tax=Pseudonocardia sp. GCM10023141 TaxID=3252653 RepID=UPI00361A56F5
MSSSEPGRRERKKQQTRKAISDIATHLFLERGFDAVTVADVAAAADVAVQTVFNHFPAKEDLFFDDVDWIEGPARAVRAAGAGAALPAVLAAHYRAALEELRPATYLAGIVRFTRTLEASPALRARRSRYAEEMERHLAEAIAGGPPGWRSRLLAAQYGAVQKVLTEELVRRLEAGTEDPDAALTAVAADADEAFGALRGSTPDS